MVDNQNKTQYGKTYTFNGKHEDDNRIEHLAARGLGIRHVQAGVMAVATFMAYALRANLSVAIVAMLHQNDTGTNTTSPPLAETYKWGEDVQGYILSSFFWGYVILQIPAGIITERYGGHRFLCFAILGSSTFTALLPLCAYYGGWFMVCINRMFQGMCQGFAFTSVFTLLGQWAPPHERSRLSSMSLGGQLLGAVASAPISGFLCSLYGWPSVFYSFGATGIAIGILMIFLGADKPAKHKMISHSEKQYIEKSLGGAKVRMRVPWSKILTSAPYWAALSAMACQSLAYLTFLVKIPTYLGTVHKFSLDDNGVLSALPYLASWLLSFVFSSTCDFLTNHKCITLTTARKLFNSIAHFGSSVCVILMSYCENRVMAVVLLTAFMGSQGASFTGVQANFVDLAPNFSGAIFCVANFSCAIFGILGPVMVAFIVTEAGSAAQWQIVFYIVAAALSLSNIVFIMIGSAEPQPWNFPDGQEGTEKTDLEEKNKFIQLNEAVQ